MKEDLQHRGVVLGFGEPGGARELQVKSKRGSGIARDDVREIVVTPVWEQLAEGAGDPELRGGSQAEHAPHRLLG